MQCKNCGALLNDDSKVCTMCGTSVENEVFEQSEIVEIPDNAGVAEETVVNEQVEAIPPVDSISEGVAMFNNSDEYHKQPKSKLGLVVAIILIIGLIAGGAFYFFIIKSPKMIFTTFINKVYKEVNIVDFETAKGSFSLETDISTKDESNEIFDIINNIFMELDYEIDYKNKTVFTKINTKYDNEKLLNLDMYLEDETGYVLLEDIYDKYLSVDVEGINEIFESTKNVEEYKSLIIEFKKAVTESLKSEYFTKESSEIKINSENIKTTKNSLVLNSTNLEAIVRDILNKLKNSDNFVDSLSKVSEIAKEEIIEEINSILDSLDGEFQEDDSQIIVSIYTKGLTNEVVRLECTMDIDDEKEVISIDVEDKNTFRINSSVLTGQIKVSEDNGKTTLDVSLKDLESEVTIGFKVSTSIEYNAKLSNVDVDNSVDVYSLTESEINEISTKLMENSGVQKLMEAFGGLSYDDEFDSNDDYDYDDNDDYFIDDGFDLGSHY